MHQILNFILFCSSTLHASDGISVHQQESKTVHTASGVSQTDSADSLLAGTRWNSMEFHLIPLSKQLTNLCDNGVYSLELLTMERKTVRNM
jgi:hypothetical protein